MSVCVGAHVAFRASCAGGPDQNANAYKLGKLLDGFVEPEVLGKDESWYCGDCKEHVQVRKATTRMHTCKSASSVCSCLCRAQARKQIDIWGVPEYLVIHLKRFQYTHLWREKINALVEYPVQVPSLLARPCHG